MRVSAYACLRSVHPYDCLLDCCLWHITAFRRVGELMEELEHLGRPWVMQGKNLRHLTQHGTNHCNHLPAPSVDRPLPCQLGVRSCLVGSTDSLRQVEFARQTIKATVAERQKVTELLKDGRDKSDGEPGSWSTVNLLCMALLPLFYKKTSVKQQHHWSILKLESRSKEAELTNSNCCTVNVLRLCALKAWCTLNCILEMHVLAVWSLVHIVFIFQSFSFFNFSSCIQQAVRMRMLQNTNVSMRPRSQSGKGKSLEWARSESRLTVAWLYLSAILKHSCSLLLMLMHYVILCCCSCMQIIA